MPGRRELVEQSNNGAVRNHTLPRRRIVSDLSHASTLAQDILVENGSDLSLVRGRGRRHASSTIAAITDRISSSDVASANAVSPTSNGSGISSPSSTRRRRNHRQLRGSEGIPDSPNQSASPESSVPRELYRLTLGASLPSSSNSRSTSSGTLAQHPRFDNRSSSHIAAFDQLQPKRPPPRPGPIYMSLEKQDERDMASAMLSNSEQLQNWGLNKGKSFAAARCHFQRIHMGINPLEKSEEDWPEQIGVPWEERAEIVQSRQKHKQKGPKTPRPSRTVSGTMAVRSSPGNYGTNTASNSPRTKSKKKTSARVQSDDNHLPVAPVTSSEVSSIEHAQGEER